MKQSGTMAQQDKARRQDSCTSKRVLFGADMERVEGCSALVPLPTLQVFYLLTVYPELFSACHPYIAGKSAPL